MARQAAQVAQRCEAAKQHGNVDLSDCDLTKFPDGCFMLLQSTSVESLNLSRNFMKSLSPRVVERWSQIKELDLSENEFGSLPDVLPNLSHLQTLHLRANQFTHIPLVVYNLHSLQTLVASYNHIDAVAAEELKSMTNLQHVDLRENPLSDSLKSQLAEREDWNLLL